MKVSTNHIPKGQQISRQTQQMPEPPRPIPHARIDEHQFCKSEHQRKTGKQIGIGRWRVPIGGEQSVRGGEKEQARQARRRHRRRRKFPVSDHGRNRARKEKHETAEAEGGDRDNPGKRARARTVYRKIRKPHQHKSKAAYKTGQAPKEDKAIARCGDGVKFFQHTHGEKPDAQGFCLPAGPITASVEQHDGHHDGAETAERLDGGMKRRVVSPPHRQESMDGKADEQGERAGTCDHELKGTPLRDRHHALGMIERVHSLRWRDSPTQLLSRQGLRLRQIRKPCRSR